jgi:hypothetical protein
MMTATGSRGKCFDSAVLRHQEPASIALLAQIQIFVSLGNR